MFFQRRGKGAEQTVDEDSQTWWRAKTAESGQWLEVDLEQVMDVRAVQINFADDDLPITSPGKIQALLHSRDILKSESCVQDGSLKAQQMELNILQLRINQRQ